MPNAPHQPPSSLSTAEKLMRLNVRASEDSGFLSSRSLPPAQWLALGGIMNASTEVTLTLWEQARALGWDLRDGAAWLVHMNRGDLVRPLAERFGFDWSQEINRLRTPEQGDRRPLNALTQALYQRDERQAGVPEEQAIQAITVVRAWEALGLDPTQRLVTPVTVFAGVRSPIYTVMHLPLNWLGVALVSGAWDQARRWLDDPRILADQEGLDQALFAWTVSVWRHRAPMTSDREREGLEPSSDPYWPDRLLAAGARVDRFPWAEGEVVFERMQIEKNEHSTLTWAQTVPHYPWLSPDQRATLEAKRAQAPRWSTAHWALRNKTSRSPREHHPLWERLQDRGALWTTLPNDDHGQSPMMVALLHGQEIGKTGALPPQAADRAADPSAWQGKEVLERLAAWCPVRTQDEVLSALHLGVAEGLWGVLNTFTAVRDQHPGHVPANGLFTDAELADLVDTLAIVAAPARSTSAEKVEKRPLGPHGDLRVPQTSDGVLTTWWTVEAPRFAGWLSPSQQTMWATWCAEMASALPNVRFAYPRQTKNQSREEHDALYHRYVEQRVLVATLATEDALAGLRADRLALSPSRGRPRL